MYGTVKGDCSYISDFVQSSGPAQYNPSTTLVTRTTPGMKFTTGTRSLGPRHKLYISKDHNTQYLATHSPGPKYSPKNGSPNGGKQAPSFSFGSDGSLADRGAFFKTGQGSRPGTGFLNPNRQLVEPKVRSNWSSKQDRFAPAALTKQVISTKATREKYGTQSPGPIYLVQHNNIRPHKTSTTTPSGQWCP